MSRSINKETRGASTKKIVPNPDINKGLVLATLTNVELGNAEIKEDSNWLEFRGFTVPRITFIFLEKVVNVNIEPGMYFKSYTAFPDLFNSEKEWQWDVMAQTLKHFIDILSENNFKDEYSELLDLKLEEGKEYTVEEQIKAWTNFFNGVITVFNGDKKKGLPALINKDVWIKLLLDVKGQKVNKGDYGMPSYPGEGIIELHKENSMPSLRVNVSKGENIIPRTYEEPTDLGSITPKIGAAPTGERPAFMQ